MCKQFVCFVCDLPLTGNGCFLKCAANPDARPPWVEPWRPTPGCPRPVYKNCNICHTQCRDTRLRNRADLQRQLGIASVIGRSDGTIDWHRSPDAVQNEAQLNIPQAPVQLVSQWHQTAQLSHLGATHQGAIAPTQGPMPLPRNGTEDLFPNNSVPTTSVATNVRDAPQGTPDSSCDSCKASKWKCDRKLPSCSQCVMRSTPCTRNTPTGKGGRKPNKRPAEDTASAAQPKRRRRREPSVDSMEPENRSGDDDSDEWRAYYPLDRERRGGDMGDDQEGSGHQESSDFEPGAEEGGEDDVLDS